MTARLRSGAACRLHALSLFVPSGRALGAGGGARVFGQSGSAGHETRARCRFRSSAVAGRRERGRSSGVARSVRAAAWPGAMRWRWRVSRGAGWRRVVSPSGDGRPGGAIVRLSGFSLSQQVTSMPEDLEPVPETTAAERAVADLLPIDAGREEARAALGRVPLWFHTFSLNGAGVYTPGIARDHRYRLRAIPEDLSGARVLDVGTFDGFYAFLAERRGAARVVAVDNEQYVAWIASRFGIHLEPGVGFRAIADLLRSGVDYRRLDALDVERLGETFDVVFCFGILHR